MTHAADLTGQRVLIVGGSRFIGAELARRAASLGAEVVIGARDLDRATEVADALPGGAGKVVRIDVLEESTIAAAAADIGEVDHVIVTAAAHHDVPVAELEHDKVVAAFEAKVIGPLMLAKHFAPRMRAGGSFVLFSGIVGWKPGPGSTVKGITNGAVAYAAAHLAANLSPLRVNAIAPGVVDSGTWDEKVGDKAAFLSRAGEHTLVGRYGEMADIADAAMWLLTAGYVTGEVIHIDGGGRRVA
ncbi:SDR family oxidoreductase [Luteipulveratus mongoliensis]|uniref:Short-chain dehydrogenase n=1 Tax=Luteipulveratus mongoliensis TaxID=571913 RepID=A0A0K1JHW6_9MICO|nr:SDR family oxidoreductase [Luteipulveratus mongoliensis]AKU16307.1 short-chain dehydrogenase [Luteipulveratus mongoliensis]